MSKFVLNGIALIFTTMVVLSMSYIFAYFILLLQYGGN